jgi:hypothetical protein
MGELLKEYDARGGDRRSKNATPLAFDRPSRTAVAQEAGVSEHKARTAVNIAAMPQDDFEAVVESGTPPGTTKLAQWMEQQHPHPQAGVRAVTRRSLDEMVKSAAATTAAEALLRFERYADRSGVERVVEILRGRSQKLERVRRAIGLAFRLNAALDEACKTA